MKSLRGWFERRQEHRSAGGQRDRRSRPGLESLESRVVLYSATGNAWLNPAVVTISFMPDGTNLGGATSNLISTFNSNPGLNGRWQNEILRAAQVSAQQTNINFVVVPDNGAASGGGDYQEGDPGYGDIRIGGYNFGNTALASAYQPPPMNNFSIAGDITFNTGHDLEHRHDLRPVHRRLPRDRPRAGLGHTSTGGNAIMYPTYIGRKIGLAADDIAGIRSIYSARRTALAGCLQLHQLQLRHGRQLEQPDQPDLTEWSGARPGHRRGRPVGILHRDVPAGTTGTMTVTAQIERAEPVGTED